MAAPVVVQVSSVLTVTTGTTGNITFTNPVTAGNAIILEIIQTASGSRTYSCSDGTNTYAVAIRAEHSSNIRVDAILHAFNIAGGTPTIAPLASASTTFRAVAYEISGLPASPTVVTGSFEDGSFVTSHNSASSGNIDTAREAAIFACGVASGTLVTITAASGFTQTASGGNGIFQYKMASGAETDQRAAWTSVTARDCISCIVAYETAATSVTSDVTIPVDWIQSAQSNITQPVDWLQGVFRDVTQPVDWLQTTTGDVTTPVDWLQVVYSTITAPIDWLQATSSNVASPVDWLQTVTRDVTLPIDWDGQAAVVLAAGVFAAKYRTSVIVSPDRNVVFVSSDRQSKFTAPAR